MDFQISGLPADTFLPLFDLGDEALARLGAKRYVADAKPGFPCRVSLADAEIGETLILAPYDHQPCAGPYRASGPIFVRRDARSALPQPGEVPAQLQTRMISVRAYDTNHLMIAAELAEGRKLADHLRQVFEDPRVSYVHLHYASAGCFACRADRA